jgi:hypothetical protein
MEVVVVLLLVIVVILILGYPIVNPQRYQNLVPQRNGAGGHQDLYTARETVFEALRDLQFEFATGKLSPTDYEALKARYEVQAAQVLQQIDVLQPRSKPGAHSVRECPRCGSAQNGQDKFCTKCGAKL